MKWLMVLILFMQTLSVQAQSRYFGCITNGKEIEIVYPDYLIGEYNLQNAMRYCKEKYGVPAHVLKLEDGEKTSEH